MASIEDQFIAAGAQIIWVLEQTDRFEPGTAENCRAFVNSRGSSMGLCVGDSQTMNQMIPSDSTWDDSPLAIGRGFDLIVPRSTMRIEEVYTHGTPGGNDNLSGEELLAHVQAVLDGL